MSYTTKRIPATPVGLNDQRAKLKTRQSRCELHPTIKLWGGWHCYVCHGYDLVLGGWTPKHLLDGEQLEDARRIAHRERQRQLRIKQEAA
jgi:hypothetical protein